MDDDREKISHSVKNPEEEFQLEITNRKEVKVIVDADIKSFQERVRKVLDTEWKVKEEGLFFEHRTTYDTVIKDGNIVHIAYIEHRISDKDPFDW
jgi:hypothetical protein